MQQSHTHPTPRRSAPKTDPKGFTKPIKDLRIIQALITEAEAQGHSAPLGPPQGAPHSPTAQNKEITAYDLTRD
ncbi:hypothetical protein ACFXPZ_45080 [Streptomyces sp. NPDC059101]|uniref:hypothetical protein n=1 Tax=Streptomyces sp. NPDC059101 TaxID=3346728 RepID=UPI0036AF08BD